MDKIHDRFSGREFNPAQAGGLLRKLSSHDVKITNRGIDLMEIKELVLSLIQKNDGQWT